MHRHSAANVSLQRLQTLPQGEHALYSRFFRELVGDAPVAVAPAVAVASLLQQSGLQQETLRRIWELADRTNDGTLDFENFCVACRLTAHAQVQAPSTSIEESRITEVPAAPPHFAGVGGDAVPSSSSTSTGRPGHAHGSGRHSGRLSEPSNGDFDFEDMALGVDMDSGGRPTRPPRPAVGVDFGMVASPGLLSASGVSGAYDSTVGSSLSLPGSKQGLRDGLGSRRSLGERSRGSEVEEGPKSAEGLAEALLPGPGQTEGSRVAQEMVEGRHNFDDIVLEKTRYETKIEQARSRLETLRQGRQESRTDLVQAQADLQHLWRMLEFERGLVEEVEREIAALREARESFSVEELAHVERHISEMTDRDGGTVSSRERNLETVAAHLARERSAVDARSVRDLAEQVTRKARRKLELQAKQQLLLAAQHQAEQDRNYAESELETARETLTRLRDDRRKLLEEQATACRAARAVARDDGSAAGHRELPSPTACASSEPLRPVATGCPNPRRQSLAFNERKASVAPEPDIATWWRSMTGAKDFLDSEGADLPYRSQSRWTKFGGREEDLSKGQMLKTM